MGIRRVTLPLPARPGHVHAYLLPGDDGWTLVDTGLGLPDARDRWAAELEELPGPVARIFVTHFHPDHVGAARDVAELTGAPVAQGRLDYEQCALVWGGDDWAERARRLVPPARRPRRGDLRARRAGIGVPAVHPLPARPRADRARRPGGRLGGRRRARACGRPADAPPRRGPRRRRSSPRPHLADCRPLAGRAGPTRSATTSTRSRRRSRSSRRSPSPGTGSPSPTPRGGPVSSSPIIATGSRRPRRRSPPSRGRATRSRSRSSAAT